MTERNEMLRALDRESPVLELVAAYATAVQSGDQEQRREASNALLTAAKDLRVARGGHARGMDQGDDREAVIIRAALRYAVDYETVRGSRNEFLRLAREPDPTEQATQ